MWRPISVSGIHRKRGRGGFSLVELVIVIVIMGVIAAIAVPRMTSAGEGAKESALRASLRRVRVQLGLYEAEHEGRSPSHNPDMTIDATGDTFMKRLKIRTDQNGGANAVAGNYGPYLSKFPANPYNGLETVRINGAVPSANTEGWHFDTSTARFSADDSVDHAAW
jgi:general secretion pathway protein G